jgi:hypothetical protein
MTSLADAYGRHVADTVGRERLYLGVGAFLVGALFTAVGVVVATTDLLSVVGLDRMAAWRRAGVLAGLGVPAMIGGAFSVLPSDRRIKAAAVIGVGVTALGVATFWYAYPAHWAGYGQDLTLVVTATYFFGTVVSLGCLFSGIATFKRRNDPGGTVSLRREGETKVVTVDRSVVEDDPAVGGGVGVVGATPDGEVATQTNVAGAGGTAAGTATEAETVEAAADTATSDGGAEDTDLRSLATDASLTTSAEAAERLADRYCGNCEHFRYVRTDEGMQPYCGAHGEVMDDMEACEQWEPNT